MTGFVYKWINQINRRWYIGSRKGTTDDGYLHSSKVLAAAMEKYGMKNFVREILFEGGYNGNKILDLETEYLNKYDAANNPMSYNLTNNAGSNCFNKATRQKMRNAKLGTTQSPEHIMKRRKALIGKTSPKKGIKVGPPSEELRRRRGKAIRKPLTIGGTVYPSRGHAVSGEKVSKQTINEWLKNGKAIDNG